VNHTNVVINLPGDSLTFKDFSSDCHIIKIYIYQTNESKKEVNNTEVPSKKIQNNNYQFS